MRNLFSPKRIQIKVTCNKKNKQGSKRPKKKQKPDAAARASIAGKASEVPLELSCIDIRSVTPDCKQMPKKKKNLVDHRSHKNYGGTIIELHPYKGRVTHRVNENEKKSPFDNYDDEVLAINSDLHHEETSPEATLEPNTANNEQPENIKSLA